jgi:hypothetical protein
MNPDFEAQARLSELPGGLTPAPGKDKIRTNTLLS